METSRTELVRFQKLREKAKNLPAAADPIPLPFFSFLEKELTALVDADFDTLLDETLNTEQKLQACVTVFQQELAWRDEFIALVQKSRQKEEPIELEDAIRLHTVHGTVLYLLTLKAAGFSPALNLQKLSDPSLKLRVGPSLFKYADQARAALGEDSGFKDSAFAAGLMFDLLSLWASHPDRAAQKAAVQSRLEPAFRRAMARTKRSLVLAAEMPQLSFEDMIPVVPLMIEAGTLGMLLLFPNYAEVLRKSESLKLPMGMHRTVERAHFHLTHLEMSSVLASSFRIFQCIFDSLRFYPSPFQLQLEGRKDEYDVMALTLASETLECTPLTGLNELDLSGLRPELAEFHLTLDARALKLLGESA